MARGEYDQAIPVRRRDEVGRLAEAFNAMARAVGRSQLQMRALIANVSHDLKTPLTSILGFSQALRDRAVQGDAAVVETGGIIHEEAERVRALVDDLLYLSEIEAGGVPLQQEAVDLGALALRSARRFAPRFAANGITFTSLPAEGVIVRGDAAKLERVLDNLLDNTAKYTPAGGQVVVRVSGGNAAELAVFNSGVTIPAEELERIFDRFYRLDRTRSGAARGSGLGLAIARELAELHGGTLSAASDAEGTRFTLRLPLAPRERVHHPHPEGAAPAPAPPLPR
jgi:two-component system sensor histidine kinase BaeS